MCERWHNIGFFAAFAWSSTLLASAATFEYTYTDNAGVIQETGAEILWPASKPTGVILIWHGTELGGLANFGSTPSEEFSMYVGSPPSDTSLFGAFRSDHIIVMPQQLGLGRSKLTRNQLWQQLKPVQADGDALLEAIFKKAKADYSLALNERMNLFIAGHSQGGTSSVVYHLHVQSGQSPTPSMYELKQTIASSGHYSAAVWEATCMTPYAEFVADSAVKRSFSNVNLPMAREMQLVLLTHLLHTYKQTVGSTDIAYEAAPSLANAAYKDDWTQMGQMIGKTMDGTDDSGGKPAFLKAATWTLLTNPSSSLRVALRSYLTANYAPISTQAIESNTIPLELVYACDDFNVPCEHTLQLKPSTAQSAPHVTFSDNSAAVQSPVSDPFAGHGAAQTLWQKNAKAKITAMKGTLATPHVTTTSTAAPTQKPTGGGVSSSTSGQLTGSIAMLAGIGAMFYCI